MSDFSNLRRLRQAKAAEMLTGFTLQAWGTPASGDSSERKIIGNPGQAAANFVSECLADFDVHGQVRTKALATHREAGEGAHGVSHGSIDVQVEIRPTHGMPVSIDIPVQVRQGYLLAPDVFIHNEVPYIIAQSSLDDVILPAQYRSPRLASLADRLQERIAKTILLTKSDVERIKQDQANRAREESEAAAKAKARRQQKQPGGLQMSADDGDWNDANAGDWGDEAETPAEDSWGEDNADNWNDAGDDVGDAACQFLHEHPGFDWSEESVPAMYEYAQQHGFEVADFVDAANDAEHRMKSKPEKAPSHGVDNTSTYETDSNYDNFGQILPFAATARLKTAQSFNLDGDETYSLPAGTAVQVLRELDTGVALIRTASAFEGYVETDDLV